MQKAGKFLILVLLVCLCTVYVPGIESQAEEMSGEQTSASTGLEDENPQRLDEVTGMDEDGNIFEVEETGGEIIDSGIAAYSRAVSVKVVNFRTKGNAVTNYTEYSTGTAGYTNGAYGADAAYLGTDGGKVKFMLSGVVGEVAASEVQVVDFSSVQSVSCYKAEDGRLLHYITQDMTTPGHVTSLDNGGAPSYLQGGVTYYSYDGHYFYTDYGIMLDDYQNNTRANSVNPGNPHYNYYQYLPFRSRTAYSGAEINSLIDGKTKSSSKLRGTGDYFVNSQNTYGVNALVMAGIAANESGWGTSSICQNKNNLFGLNAVDSSPGTSANTYASVEECIRQFADGWMSRKYLKPGNWVYNGGFLGNKASGVNVKYASDPYWGEKAANIIWRLDQSGGSRDANAYTIGIKDTLATGHTSVNVRSGSSTSNPSLYMTGSASNYAVLVQDPAAENSFYRIQSDAVLNADRGSVNKETGKYDYDNMYAYISSNFVTLVNQGETVNPPAPKVLESISISQPPTRTEYMAGETFDASGMVVMAKWNDGTESDVTAEVTYSTDALSEGTGSITVSYTNEGVTVTADQAITVNTAKPPAGNDTPVAKRLESISISQPPTRTEYTAGETFDASGMVIMAKWNDGTESDVTAEVTYSTDALSEGTGSITVSYTNEGVTVTADQAVKVNASVPADNNTPTEGTPAPEQQPTVSTPAPTPEQQPTVSTPALTPTPEQKPADNAPAATQPAEGTPKLEQQPEGSQQPTDTTPGTDPKQPGGTSSEPVFQPAADAGKTSNQKGAGQAENGSGNISEASGSSNAGHNTSNESAQARKAPRTGDESNLILWSVLFVLSASGMLSVIQRKKEWCRH